MPLRRFTSLRSRKKPASRWRSAWRPSDEGLAAYDALRTAVCEREKGRCQDCGRWIGMSGTLAHVHTLGMGRSRYDPEAQCSLCGTMLNVPENGRWLDVSCHRVYDRVSRPCARRTPL